MRNRVRMIFYKRATDPGVDKYDVGMTGAGFAAVIAGVMLLLMTVVGVGSLLVDRAQCRNLAVQTGRSTRYDNLVGCLIFVDGQWIPTDNWRPNGGTK